MILTILEARVDKGRENDLITMFREVLDPVPESIVESFLVHCGDPDVWRIVTVWRSMDDLNANWERVGTPRGIRAFRAAGAEPELTISDVVVHRPQNASGAG